MPSKKSWVPSQNGSAMPQTKTRLPPAAQTTVVAHVVAAAANHQAIPHPKTQTANQAHENRLQNRKPHKTRNLRARAKHKSTLQKTITAARVNRLRARLAKTGKPQTQKAAKQKTQAQCHQQPSHRRGGLQPTMTAPLQHMPTVLPTTSLHF